MAIDWSKAGSTAETAIANAETQTNAELASMISSLTVMKDVDVQKLFPTPADAKRLADLMSIVASSEDATRKQDRLIANIQGLAGTIITLLGRV